LLLTNTHFIHAFFLSYLLVLVTYSARTHNFDPTLTNNPCFSLLRCAVRDSCSFYTYHTVHIFMLTGMDTHMRFHRSLPWFPSTVCVRMLASPSWNGPAYFSVRPCCFCVGACGCYTRKYARVFSSFLLLLVTYMCVFTRTHIRTHNFAPTLRCLSYFHRDLCPSPTLSDLLLCRARLLPVLLASYSAPFINTC